MTDQDQTSHKETETFAIEGGFLWNEVSWNTGAKKDTIKIQNSANRVH